MLRRSFFLALAAVLAGCTAPGDKPWVRHMPEEDRSLHAVTGPELRELVAAAEAQVVLLNVWATWCVTCREEFPDLLKLRDDYHGLGVAVIFVSGDFPDEREAVLAMLDELGVTFPTYIKDGPDMRFIEALHPEWSGALPASFVFDSQGRLREWWEGKRTYDEFAAALDRAIQRALHE